MCSSDLEEARNTALDRTTVYQQDLRNYHSRRLRTRSFMVVDLVLRLKQKKVHKLASPWEGPFIVTEVIDGGTYRLKHAKIGELSHDQHLEPYRPWLAEELHDQHSSEGTQTSNDQAVRRRSMSG